MSSRHVTAPARSLWLVYWIPLAATIFGIWAGNHETWHAANASGVVQVEVDLSSVVSGTNRLRQIGYLMIGAVGATLYFAYRRADISTDRRLYALVLALWVYTVLSCLWSDSIGLSFRRVMIPCLLAIAAWGIGRQWPAKNICYFVVHVTLFFILLGIFYELRFGTFLRGEEYRFSGTLHPNRQAVYCAALLFASLCLYLDAGTHRLHWLILSVVGGILLVLTGSRTGIFSTVAVLILLWAVRAKAPHRFLVLVLLPLVIGGGVLLVVAAGTDISESFIEAVKLGRQQEPGEVKSLTGRIPIWIELSQNIAARPLLGYGYGSFWTGERVYYLSALLNWEFDHAHSMYLQTMLHVGGLGLGLGLVIVGYAIVRARAAYAKTGNPGFLFCLAWLMLALVHGLLDTIFGQPGFTMLICMICVSLVVFLDPEDAEVEA